MPLWLVRGEQRVFAAWTVEAEDEEDARDKVMGGEAGEPELDDDYVEIIAVESAEPAASP